jgi:protein TonB
MPPGVPESTISRWRPMVLESNSIAGVERALRVSKDSSYFLRLLTGTVLGAIATLALAWFMHYLIQSSDASLSDASRAHMLDFVRIKREESLERKDRTPERPQVSKSPEIPPMPESQTNSGQQLQVSAMPVQSNININQGGIGFGAGEGDYLPIVKVAPIFPLRALARGVFGECLVRYTVTTAGTVKDVEVIEDRCTSLLFHRPSREAAQRFKYKPRVIDGEPVEVRGALNMFYYREVEPGG